MARPRHEPTDDMRDRVAKLAAFGKTDKTIARMIGVSLTTLKKYYKYELELGLDAIEEEMGGLMIELARAGNFKGLAFVLEKKCGWGSEVETNVEPPKRVEVTVVPKGKDFNPYDE